MTLQDIKDSLGGRKIFIAEVKVKSPFSFESSYSWDDLFKIANQYGDIISIHTDARWGGSFELLQKARGMTDKPILAKGFHYVYELEWGGISDFVLQVEGTSPFKSARTSWDRVFYEPYTQIGLNIVLRDTTLWTEKYTGARQFCKNIVINARNPYNGDKGEVKYNKISEEYKKLGTNFIQASCIKNKEDIKDWAAAYIVGQNLVEFCENL